MRTVDEWKTLLRAAMKDAMRRREAEATAALRETLAAIDNAEAVTPPAQTCDTGSMIAGAVGVGASEAQRRHLTEQDVAAVVAGELEERRQAAAMYEKLGMSEEACRLRQQIELLESL
jgi:uncharacterized protein YqeY